LTVDGCVRNHYTVIIRHSVGIFQLIAHDIVVNLRLKSPYNPGLGAVVFLLMPIGIYSIWYVTTNHLARTADFVVGFFAFVFAAVLLFLLPIQFMVNKESKYPFAEAEVYGFDKAKIEKIKNS
jgi:hypothetical protein